MDFYQYVRQEWYGKSANIGRNWGLCPLIDLRNLELTKRDCHLQDQEEKKLLRVKKVSILSESLHLKDFIENNQETREERIMRVRFVREFKWET